MSRLSLVFVSLLFVSACGPQVAAEPEHWVYVSAGEFERAVPFLERDDIAGAEVIYASGSSNRRPARTISPSSKATSRRPESSTRG